ncbi:MAG: peptidylprolyl isomerase [Clostridia bacterium]|nr:peptidylprolyl isomerase [Clostridia bacterium]MBQ3488820.1 peptidylprolyl isomerase [Clostridia bacterium]MBQ3652428.1 peptidylprolyl isomerase [Clostridia bacterium]MBQ7754312.1 peptidylprolyl isomerase [Clostridia bacterium]MBQ9323503.1 peptidylprolyl isomerase [Clostridia bacterium]
MMLCSLACAKEATSAPAAEKTETKEETNVDKTHPIATITMKDGGVIELELYPEIAPESVKNFISLSNSGFYDGLIFHRVIAGFMIQGGDPDGRGTGGPGYCIKGEFSANGVKNDLSHLRGVISMARAQPFDSAGSQFFICHADSQFLDGQYAAFGKVTSGLDVVDRIAKTTTDSRDKPYKDQIMETVRVETWGVEYGEPEKLPGK